MCMMEKIRARFRRWEITRRRICKRRERDCVVKARRTVLLLLFLEHVMKQLKRLHFYYQFNILDRYSKIVRKVESRAGVVQLL